MIANKILLGFEVGSGNEVYLESLHHTMVSGVTQKSGKTTLLEGLISRSGKRAIAFKTKRGEAGFNSYNVVQPYFQEQRSEAVIDWQYVSSILEATMREKMLFPRAWIIKMCNGQAPRRKGDVLISPAHTLEEVYKNIVTAQLNPSTRGIDDGVYTNLRAYFDIIIPEIKKYRFSNTLTLEKGINVMDLTNMRFEMQSLVIASVIDYANVNMSNVVVVVPEAWEFVPQGRSSPVKLAAQRLAKKGASVGNYLFLDSQTVTSVDKEVLKQCLNWIMGLQTEINEVKRTLDQIGGAVKLKPEAIMNLPLGHFWAKLDRKLFHVYALPAWLPEDIGRRIALGELSPDEANEFRIKETNELTNDEKAELLRLREEAKKPRVNLDDQIKKIQDEAAHLVGVASDEKTRAEAALQTSNEMLADAGKEITRLSAKLRDADAGLKLVEAIKALMPQSPASSNCSTQPLDLAIQGTINRVEVTHTLKRIDLTTETFAGKIAYLYATGKLAEIFEHRDIKRLFDEKGWGFSNAQVSDAMRDLVGLGIFYTKPAGNKPRWLPTQTAEDLQKKGLLKVTETIQ